MHVNRYEAARKCTCYSFSSLGQWNGKLPRDSSPSSASSFTHHRMFTSHPKNDHLTTQCDSPVRSHFVMFYVLPGMQQVPTYFRFSVSLRMQSHCCEFSFSPFFHRLCLFDSISELGNNVSRFADVGKVFFWFLFAFYSVHRLLQISPKRKALWRVKGANKCVYEVYAE